MYEEVQESIAAFGCFVYIGDESADTNNVEEAVHIVRYLDKTGRPQENFISLTPLHSTTAEGIYEKVVAVMDRAHIPIYKMAFLMVVQLMLDVIWVFRVFYDNVTIQGLSISGAVIICYSLVLFTPQRFQQQFVVSLICMHIYTVQPKTISCIEICSGGIRSSFPQGCYSR